MVGHRDERRGGAAAPGAPRWDTDRAFTVISEMVWWVTIVDGTLVRYHPETYDTLMVDQGPAGRQVVEGTLAGLRFVRNRIRSIGHDAGSSRRPAWPNQIR